VFSFRKGWPSRPCWRNAKIGHRLATRLSEATVAIELLYGRKNGRNYFFTATELDYSVSVGFFVNGMFAATRKAE
jgi:hypothetical protein